MITPELESLYKDLSCRLDAIEKYCIQLESAICLLPMGLIILNAQGQILSFNPKARQLLESDDLSGLHYTEAFEDETFGFSFDAFIQAKNITHRVFLTLANGTELEVLASHNPRSIVIVLNDRTQTARLEKTNFHNQQLSALGQMAAQLAHEIRNPLGGIEGFASMLRSELSCPDHKKMAQSIIEGSQTLNSLVTSVLDFSKPLELHFQKENLKAILEHSCALSQYHAQVVECDENFYLLADKHRLTLAFLNLIRNGYEASDGQAVLISLKGSKLRFTDSGCGIDPKILPQLFTPFFTTKSQGTGLGLCEADKVIKAHGGRLEIEKTSCQGTTFLITWDSHD
jgi:two-component system sensor histidine kinase AtoS